MGSLKEDIKGGAEWTVKAFKALGNELDYSVKSVEHIENLLEEQFKNGQPIEGGLFSNGLGGKAFSIASYIGEVIIRNTKNTSWEFDPIDPDNEMNMMVSSSNGSKVWPMQKLGKRLQNGNEDNIYYYVAIIVKNFNEEINTTQDSIPIQRNKEKELIKICEKIGGEHIPLSNLNFVVFR